MSTHDSALSTTEALSLPIHLRAYAEPPKAPRPDAGRVERPSEWAVIFDTETTTDHAQALRFGTYQVRRGGELIERGIFHRAEVLTPDELALSASYAAEHGLKLRSQADFIEMVLFRIGYRYRATIIGFNLPFDIARIAIDHGFARRDMRGGFTFTLSPYPWWPQLRVRHINGRISFASFAAPAEQRTGRSDRKRKRKRPVRRGFFVDVSTLAHALLSRGFSLESLAEHLGTPARKAKTEEHGGPLTAEYIEYAVQDVQVTWECFDRLRDKYHRLGLATPLHRIYSEASIGKAYLQAMGVKPWREVQPDVPPPLLGIIMATFYGGRSEVRLRHEVRQVVLCDFLSMYPTVSTLMQLWRFVIARGMKWRNSTAETTAFLEAAKLHTLRDPGVWEKLTTLVQIQPDGDVLPVRAQYPGSSSATIGANHLTAPPLWYTLADCLASKILTGRAPKVLRALTFTPDEPQSGLSPIAINGDSRIRVDPLRHDLYKELITRRQTVKAERDRAEGAEKDRLDAVQNATKIAANATCFGIFAEIVVGEPTRKLQIVTVHTGTGTLFQKTVRSVEIPGRYFHPLLATLTTGAARLMLAITERLVTDAGLSWAFCDTDSMAIARPPEMDEATFHARVDEVVGWFASLNPYGFKGSVLQVEKVNQRLDNSCERKPLFVFAISAKRYALLNLGTDGQPILRKASAHGLGHLRASYGDDNPAPGIPAPMVSRKDLNVSRWQHDVWWTIADAALRGPLGMVGFDYHPALQRPAVSRYAATTPAIHGWFKDANRNQPYDRQVRPFGFVNAYTALDGRPAAAPFDGNTGKSSDEAFDRRTGERIPSDELSTYAHALGGYHRSAESKFENGRPFDWGETRRRHVHAAGFVHIGKEANRWEEQFFLGLDPEAEITYGGPGIDAEFAAELERARSRVGERRLADSLGIARETLRRLMNLEDRSGSEKVLAAVRRSLNRFWREMHEQEAMSERALQWLEDEIELKGVALVARRVGIDPSNLAAIRSQRRRMSKLLLRLITASLNAEDAERHPFKYSQAV